MKNFFGIETKFWYLILANAFLGAALITINYLYLSSFQLISQIINVLAAFILVFPIVIIKYEQYNRVKNLEEMFPVFLRDFVESIRSGMSVPQAIKMVSGNDYKSLTPHIKKISAQLEWGIPIDKVLLKFVKEANSKLIGRIVSSVIESHNFGGNLAETFEALSGTALEVEKLRQERRLYLNSQMMTGYIVFFVFLLVIIGLEKFLVPSLSNTSALQLGGGGLGTAPTNLGEAYKEIFRNLVVIQGLFAGLAVGKMAEGALISGVKHSFIMVFVGMAIFIVADQLPI